MFAKTFMPTIGKYARTFASKKLIMPTKRVAITGAAGQVAYSILFRIASYAEFVSC